MVKILGLGDSQRQQRYPGEDSQLRVPKMRPHDPTQADAGHGSREQQAVADVLVQRDTGMQVHLVGRRKQSSAAQQQAQG